MTKFSIIIPTYQRIDLLIRALSSVIDQDYSNYEVIICSDGYSKTDEQCVLSINDDRFLYDFIEKKQFKNWGHVQRNEMIVKCTGDYIIWLDDDNVIEQDYLSFANNVIEEKNFGMLIFKINHNNAGIIPKKDEIIYAQIDTLNAMVKTEIAKKIKWKYVYDADYFFIKDVEQYCLKNNFTIKFFKKIIGTHH